MFTKRIMAAVAGLGVVGALAVGLLTTNPAAAAPVAGGIIHAAGKISAVQKDGFTLQNPQHTYNVTVGANTWIVVQKNNQPAQGTLADLQVNEKILVGGISDGASHIDARLVVEGGLQAALGGANRPAHAGQHGQGTKASHGLANLRHGTIRAINNGVLTIQAAGGTKTTPLNTDAGTIVLKGGLASVGDLKVGDVVTILRRPNARLAGSAPVGTTAPATRRVPTAELIYVPQANDQISLGAVKNVSGSTITLGGFGSRTVTTTGSTVFKRIPAAGQAPVAASRSDVQARTRILVYGPTPAAGQAARATLVLILPAKTH
ncbi:MAG TPA: DUF5666 domain-containing protein [Chloroflexia bacterium]|nr:DUF5666 domain-containing protein [Chloroflexia bacterium]